MPDSLSNSGKRITDILNHQVNQVHTIISETKLRKTASGTNQKAAAAADKSLKAANVLLASLMAELKVTQDLPPPDIESDRRMLRILTVSTVPVRIT
jgi:hypothetical protein